MTVAEVLGRLGNGPVPQNAGRANSLQSIINKRRRRAPLNFSISPRLRLPDGEIKIDTTSTSRSNRRAAQRLTVLRLSLFIRQRLRRSSRTVPMSSAAPSALIISSNFSFTAGDTSGATIPSIILTAFFFTGVLKKLTNLLACFAAFSFAARSSASFSA